MIIKKKFIVSEKTFERELFGNFDENIKKPIINKTAQ